MFILAIIYMAVKGPLVPGLGSIFNVQSSDKKVNLLRSPWIRYILPSYAVQNTSHYAQVASKNRHHERDMSDFGFQCFKKLN